MAKTASDVLRDLSKKVKDVTKTEAKSFDFLLDEIPMRIIRRTLLGKDIDNSPLKKLSPNYIKARKKISLGSDAKPTKSNLTLTGEMLSSIDGKRSGSLFTFFFSNSFANDKARWAKDGGRPFFGLSETDKKGLTTKISSIFRQILRDTFKG
jgi:hypothetical protein